MQYSKNLGVHLKRIFEEKFTKTPQFVFSPGRINLIGEHTDYNDGFVMPAAIDKGIYIAFAKNENNRIRLFSYDFDETVEVELKKLEAVSTGWANYILGVVNEIQKIKPLSSGFDMVFGGDIPIGSGLSSSAALECGVGVALNNLFNVKLQKIQIARIGQAAEHNFVGVRCGIMDQFASIMGKKNHTIQLDCRSLEYEYFPSNFEEYQILLCNSKVKHSLAESSYNQRREECEKGVQILKEKYPLIESLRDVTLEMLDILRHRLSNTLYNRCSYIIEENQRVVEASKLLKQNKLKQLGALLFESHQGLSKKYEVSCEELDFLVDLVKNNSAVLGSRMMGGGFGGCTINLVERSAKENLVKELTREYDKKYNIALECYEVELENGTHLINHEFYGSI
ncbi:galactokinase [Aquimarina celericrescens]|uniref:Galactokinase n=1 Tax=Aquimarina celericrescens TaxID=1964542 RepID=A0ABW5B0J7_9FLAO|nr:galactokinase [Aquimarina celericrescens]